MANGTLHKGPWSEGRSAQERVDSVTTFTGSAFYRGPRVTPVLVFPDGFVSLTPAGAFQFTPETPRVPVAPEAKRNYQFLLKVIHWLSNAAGMPIL